MIELLSKHRCDLRYTPVLTGLPAIGSALGGSGSGSGSSTSTSGAAVNVSGNNGVCATGSGSGSGNVSRDPFPGADLDLSLLSLEDQSSEVVYRGIGVGAHAFTHACGRERNFAAEDFGMRVAGADSRVPSAFPCVSGGFVGGGAAWSWSGAEDAEAEETDEEEEEEEADEEGDDLYDDHPCARRQCPAVSISDAPPIHPAQELKERERDTRTRPQRARSRPPLHVPAGAPIVSHPSPTQP